MPAEVVAGAIDTMSGIPFRPDGRRLSTSGAGRFTLNTLRLRENSGADPVAERLLRNMLRYAAPDVVQLPADLPAGFDAQLKAMAY